MAAALPLGAALKRGALIAVANWPLVVVEFVIESLYKLVLAVPIVGGGFMVAVLLGADVHTLFAEGVRSAVEIVIASLVGSPVALVSFVSAVALVAIGGALVMFVVKAGTLAVLIAAERSAGEIHRPPLGYDALRRAYAYSMTSVLDGARLYARRAVSLGLWLSIAYSLVAAGYLGVVAGAVRAGAGSLWISAGPLIVLATTSVAVIAVTLVNLIYDLLRIIVVSDDCGIGEAFERLRLFVIADARQVLGIFGVVGALFTLAAAASLFATAGLGLIGWIPLVGLLVVPLQAAAWLVRGLVFQCMGLTALSAYQTQYRRFAEPKDQPRPVLAHA